jgi:hypothetical protein
MLLLSRSGAMHASFHACVVRHSCAGLSRSLLAIGRRTVTEARAARQDSACTAATAESMMRVLTTTRAEIEAVKRVTASGAPPILCTKCGVATDDVDGDGWLALVQWGGAPSPCCPECAARELDWAGWGR